MRRLLYVISFTSDLERTKLFYRDALGLTVQADTPFMVNFANDGNGLVLLAVQPSQTREVELCFESSDVAATVDRLAARGVEFLDELQKQSFGTVIHFRDHEGHLLSLLQPSDAAAEERPSARLAQHGERERAAGEAFGRPGARGLEQTALALEESSGAGSTPRLSTAIINVSDLAAAHAYYRNVLGLGVSVDSPTWVQFQTGETRLALHSRRDRDAADLALTQPVSFGFTVPDLEHWVDEARRRNVPFVSAPADQGLGLSAEIVDPEGNVVVVREPISDASLEERLAEAFEDDETPHAIAMRRPVTKAAGGTSRLAVKPDYKTKRVSSRRSRATEEEAPPPARAAQASSARGGGPAGSRVKPKTLTDTKRARARPAIGRLKKAEIRTLETHTRSVAQASRAKPVKKAAAKKSRRGAR